jgi:hypothetical protein
LFYCTLFCILMPVLKKIGGGLISYRFIELCWKK